VVLLLQSIVNGLVDGSGYVLMALGLTLVFGIGRVINFAHGELYVLGAFIAVLFISHSFPYFSTIFLAPILVGLFGVLIERFIIRRVKRPGLSIWAPFLATLALLVILQSLYLIIFGPDPQIVENSYAYKSLNIGFLTLTGQDVFIITGFLLVVFSLVWFIRKTKYGMAMRAVSQDHDTSLLMGVDIIRIYRLTWFLGVFLAAMAGVLITPVATVDPYIGRMPLLKGLSIVIVGGLGSVEGAVLSGIFLGLIESLASTYISPSFKDGWGYLLVILVLLLRPRGLLGRTLRRG
jgi:branched-chain amino acid transport system permease protein